MTALLSLEGLALDDVLTIPPYDAGPAESVVGLRAGERMTVRDLLRALLLPSANDAAYALAIGLSGSVESFVDEMNARAKELGLKDTSYANPIGLDDEDNHSSARDLVKLAQVLRRKPFFRETVDLPRAVLRSGSRRRVVQNRNLLVRDVPEVDGVKTGRTSQAGYVLVGKRVARRRHGHERGAGGAERGGPRRRQPRPAALRPRPLPAADRPQGGDAARQGRPRVPRRGGRARRLDTVQRVLRRGEKARTRVVGAPTELDGPLPAGAEVGTVEVRLRGKVVERVPLVTAVAVEEASMGDRVASVISEPASILLVVVLVGCTVLLALLRRRVVGRAVR